jgi:hypothetical protein
VSEGGVTYEIDLCFDERRVQVYQNRERDYVPADPCIDRSEGVCDFESYVS